MTSGYMLVKYAALANDGEITCHEYVRGAYRDDGRRHALIRTDAQIFDIAERAT